jgi:hypothetical protein
MMHAEGDYMPETVEALGLIGPVHENVVPNIVDKLEVADVNQKLYTISGSRPLRL